MSKFETPEPPPFTDEEIFRQYMENLDLKPEDFNKKILDVGSGSGQFARWAKEHHVSSEIYSLEPFQESSEKSKLARGKAETIPFRNESFDLVVSSCAIPQIYSEPQYEGRREEKIRESLLELLRVVKAGGEIRIGPIAEGKGDDWRKDFRTSLDKILNELKQQRLIIEEKSLREQGIWFDSVGNVLEKEKVSLFKIYKPSK